MDIALGNGVKAVVEFSHSTAFADVTFIKDYHVVDKVRVSQHYMATHYGKAAYWDAYKDFAIKHWKFKTELDMVIE